MMSASVAKVTLSTTIALRDLGHIQPLLKFRKSSSEHLPDLPKVSDMFARSSRTVKDWEKRYPVEFTAISSRDFRSR
jgi:hypothetical protein